MSNWQEAKNNPVFKAANMTFIDSVPDNVIAYLQKKYSDISASSSLAGHIKNQYFYKDWPSYVSQFVESKVESPNSLAFLNNSEVQTFKGYKSLSKIKLSSLWINLQKKYEFNPPHTHSGIFSFIIFLNVPYNLNDELKYFKQSSFAKNVTSCLNFSLVNIFKIAVTAFERLFLLRLVHT